MKLLGKIERRLNQVLALDPETQSRLADLSGQVILVELINTEISLYILPIVDGFHLLSDYAGDANVKIRGTPSDMVSYLVNSRDSSSRGSANIEVIGDVGLAQDFQSIMKCIDLDWEEQLSRWFGDELAHKLGGILRGTVKFVSNTGDKLQRDVSEYLKFESKLTLDQTELAEFSEAIDVLRNDVERLKLRIMRLQQTRNVQS
jgi:ubiquinone biosynthesis protein UbiJ